MTKTQERRLFRKVNNLCQHCGGSFDSDIHRQCLDKLKARRRACKNSGLCRDCRFPLDSQQHEQKCKQKRRLESGFCPKCKQSINSEAHEKCKARQRELKKAKYAQAIEIGICPGHPSRKSVIRGKCEECWFRALSRAAIGGKAGWKELKIKLENQDYRCFYTGELLSAGHNASLDHIDPVSRGGERTIENVQWVTISVNRLKDILNHEEFLLLCEFNWKTRRHRLDLDEKTKLMIQVWEHQIASGRSLVCPG